MHPNSSIGIIQTGFVSWLQEDLDAFFHQYAPSLVGVRPSIEIINSGQRREDLNGFTFHAEADLDFEYVMSLTSRSVINYQIGFTELAPDINGLLASLDESYCSILNSTFSTKRQNSTSRALDCGTQSSLPAVLSISYAWNESGYPPEFLRRQCLEFLKLGLRGVSVIVSSADHGIVGQDGSCLMNGRSNPTLPSVCPYVTSIGATELHDGNNGLEEVSFVLSTNESSSTALAGSSSGGGFSNVFDTPIYQKEAVKDYFAHGRYSGVNGTLYNAKGRGFPDVAAIGKNYVVVVEGQPRIVHGTSAAAPTVASLVALINDARIAEGKSTVGFLNQVLYKHPWAFNDITKGQNFGCNGTQGFSACHGWDPVTGLGSPDFKKLLKVYLSLP